MLDDPFVMVIAIVLIVSIAGVLKARMGVRRDRHGNELIAPAADPDAQRLREEMRVLKERVAVLERIATDDTTRLESQIEALRDR